MAVAINFLIFYMVGISTFYFGFVIGFNFIVSTIASLFSGNFIPLDILPPYLLNIANYLPFKFIVFVPISIITGKISLDNAPIILLSGFAWTIMLYLSAVILYKQGLKRYEAFGG
jgi:ABC-2 type transport system permease protein